MFRIKLIYECFRHAFFFSILLPWTYGEGLRKNWTSFATGHFSVQNQTGHKWVNDTDNASMHALQQGPVALDPISAPSFNKLRGPGDVASYDPLSWPKYGSSNTLQEVDKINCTNVQNVASIISSDLSTGFTRGTAQSNTSTKSKRVVFLQQWRPTTQRCPHGNIAQVDFLLFFRQEKEKLLKCVYDHNA